MDQPTTSHFMKETMRSQKKVLNDED
jgi:hypothetical protein